MTSSVHPPHNGAALREKHRVALSSLAAAFMLVGMKLGVGLWTNSLGLLSEALHSALDLLAAGITLWAVRVSGKPADQDHTYGHGKFENLSALVESLLLLLTCGWIIYEALNRLLGGGHVKVEPNVWAFLVVIISIVVDVSRSRALRAAAHKHRSQALEADALHFSTDVWSSLVVLGGLTGVVVAQRWGPDWLVGADAVAALVVAAVVIQVGLRLGRRSVDDLLDRAPGDLQQQVRQAASSAAGVEEVTQVRVRRSGPTVFADITLGVDQSTGFEQAHSISERAEAAVRRVLPEADVIVHVEPVSSRADDLTSTVRVLAARHGLGAHAIRIYELHSGRSLELHVEVDQSLTLEEAHRQASQFEEELRRALPDLARIVTHIEPAGDAAATHQARPVGQLEVLKLLGEFRGQSDIEFQAHDVRVQQVGEELSVSLHCTLEPETAITDAHELTVRVEDFLRQRIPGVGRVLIHVEPPEESSGGRSEVGEE